MALINQEQTQELEIKETTDFSTVPQEAVIKVREITTLYANLQENVIKTEALIMERTWGVRADINDPDLFSLFMAQTSPFTADQANNMANTWEAARQNRDIRELAKSNPSRALEFVHQIFNEGVSDEVLGNPKEVLRLLALPIKKKMKAIGDLLEAKKTGKYGRKPEDVEQIKTLTAEKDALVEALGKTKVADIDDSLNVQINKMEKELLAIRNKLLEHGPDHMQTMERAKNSDDKTKDAAIRVYNFWRASIESQMDEYEEAFLDQAEPEEQEEE